LWSCDSEWAKAWQEEVYYHSTPFIMRDGDEEDEDEEEETDHLPFIAWDDDGNRSRSHASTSTSTTTASTTTTTLLPSSDGRAEGIRGDSHDQVVIHFDVDVSHDE